MGKNSLDLIDPELSIILTKAREAQLRAATLAVCRYVIENNNLTERVIDDALGLLETNNYGNTLTRKKLEMLVDVLDQRQWDLQDLKDEGKIDEVTYSAAFKRARAANALFFALDTNSLEAATEAIYEANAAVDNNPRLIKSLVLEALEEGQ